MAGKGVLTAEDLQEQSRRSVQVESGHTVVIARIGLGPIMEVTKGIPDLASIGQKVAKGNISGDAGELTARLMESVLLHGVVVPRLQKQRNPDGTGCLPSDFTRNDRQKLFVEILQLSGFTQEAADEVRPLSKTHA